MNREKETHRDPWQLTVFGRQATDEPGPKREEKGKRGGRKPKRIDEDFGDRAQRLPMTAQRIA